MPARPITIKRVYEPDGRAVQVLVHLLQRPLPGETPGGGKGGHTPGERTTHESRGDPRPGS